MTDCLSHLSPAERRALELFLPRVRELLGPELFEARLFGSRARGEGHEESDLDVALIVTARGRDCRHAVYELAFEAMLETAIDLAPLVIDRAHLDHLRARERRLARDLDTEGIPL